MRSKLIFIISMFFICVNVYAGTEGGSGDKNRFFLSEQEFMHNENIDGTSRHTIVNLNSGNSALTVYQMFNDTRNVENYSAGIGLSSTTYNSSGGLGANSGVFAILSPGNAGFIHHYNKPWIWKTNPSDDGLLANTVEKMRLTPDGKLGIGTTSPSYKLQVEGDIQGDDYYSGDGTQGITTTQAIVTDNGDTCSITVKDGLITGFSEDCPIDAD